MAEKYDYYLALSTDIKCVLEDEDLSVYKDVEEAFEHFYDEFWAEDYITGNGIGTYTNDAYQAEEHICHNINLFLEAMREFGDGPTRFIGDPEGIDVTIRCYLLGGVLQEVLEELFEERSNA